MGATGFIGAHLAKALIAAGAEVCAASRSVNPSSPPISGATWTRCDASVPTQVADLFRLFKPEIVYHLTSDSHGGRELDLIPNSIRNDLTATVNVLTEAARIGGVRVVLAGSFEEPTGLSSEAVPSSPYAASKWASCGYARMISALHGLQVTILRLMMVYGPGQKDYKVIPYVIKQLHAGKAASLSSAERLLDWVYIDDVVEAFLYAGYKPWISSRSIDIGSGQLTRLRDALTTIGHLMKRPELLEFGAIGTRAMEREEASDNSKAELILGWRPSTSFEDGILKAIESYR